MQNFADNDSLPQACPHQESHRDSLFDKEEEASSPFGIVFLYSAIGSPCWTESDSHQSSLDSFCTNTPLHDTSTNWEIDQEVEMAASWSSAATGKPQLSYAERLRRAKEGTPKADLTVSASQPHTDVKTLSPNGRSHHEPSSQEHMEKRSSSSLQRSEVPVSSMPSAPNQDVKADSTGSSTTGKAVINVWDARRRMLQEKEKAKEEQKNVALSNGVKADVPQSRRSESDTTAKATSTSESDSTAPEDGDKTKKQVERNEPWLQNVHLLNGRIENGTKEKVTVSSQAREGKGKKKKGVEAAPSTSNAKNNKLISMPSIADATAWPSPDDSLSAGSKANTDNNRKQDGERGAAPLSPVNGLQGLNVEVIKPRAGLGSPKRGKQWVPIVPTITHTTTLSGNASRKKPKAPNASTSTLSSSRPVVATPIDVESKAIPTLPTTFTRRADQKKPTPLPISTDNEEVQSDLRISGGNEAKVLQSPSHDLRGLSPRLARMALSNQSRTGSLAASPRRDYSSSPLRSPLLAGGSVRGPRFSGDLKSPKEAHTFLQPLSSDDVPLNLSIQSGNENEGEPSRNALFLSDGYNSEASPLASTQMSQNATTDGSYPPTRASTSLLSPTSQSMQQQGIIPWRTDSMNRSPSSAPSPRGSRGRGKTSKTSDGHSVGESSGSRNDNEERGLPSDVPSGPRRQHNGNGTPPRGYGAGAGGGSFRRGPYYQHPFPYGMYGPPQPPPGAFFYPHPGQMPLESTPTEFAPQGDATKSEPSEALLHQIEFYFSHRNLEGDFFLRKSMDSQGFVPIKVVSNFNKVKNMTDKLDVIKETLLFSKVLFVDTERELVRKAVDWHLYTLIDGERPQQSMYSPRQSIPHFGSPPPPSSLPPFAAHASPPFAPYYGQPGPPPPFYFSSPYDQPRPAAAGEDLSGQNNPPWSQQQLQRSTGSADEHHSSNGEASGDNIFGVIAAEGLAAEKRPE